MGTVWFGLPAVYKSCLESQLPNPRNHEAHEISQSLVPKKQTVPTDGRKIWSQQALAQVTGVKSLSYAWIILFIKPQVLEIKVLIQDQKTVK